MKFVHATPARNLASIERSGLLTSKSRGKLAVVWLAAKSAAVWAFLHVIRRHRVRPEGVVLIEVDLPGSWVRKTAKKRLYYCPRDVPADRLGTITGFSQLTGPTGDR